MVYGPDVMKAPLLDSPEPNMVMLKDSLGDPKVLLVRILSDDTWGMCTKGDPDWTAMLVRYGFKDVDPKAGLKDIVENGVDKYVGPAEPEVSQ